MTSSSGMQGRRVCGSISALWSPCTATQMAPLTASASSLCCRCASTPASSLLLRCCVALQLCYALPMRKHLPATGGAAEADALCQAWRASSAGAGHTGAQRAPVTPARRHDARSRAQRRCQRRTAVPGGAPCLLQARLEGDATSPRNLTQCDGTSTACRCRTSQAA